MKQEDVSCDARDRLMSGGSRPAPVSVASGQDDIRAG